MKCSYLILIYLTTILFRASTNYFVIADEDRTPYLFIAGFLALLLALLRQSRPLRTFVITYNNTEGTPQPRCNAGYNFYSGPGRSFCYRIDLSCKTWNDSRTACQREMADLSVLDDESLGPFTDVLIQQFPAISTCPVRSAVWLGAKTLPDRLVARYIDGRDIPSNSQLWTQGEPNTPNDCVLVGSDGGQAFLLDRPCPLLANYVCQQL